MYFEDFQVGYSFTTDPYLIPKHEIIDFAQQWDPQPFHIDEVAAEDYPYGGLIASGWHTLLISFRLMLETGKFKDCSIGSPGMQELRWLLPVKPGDTLCNKARVESAKLSKSKPDRGFVTVQYEVLNQKEQKVATYLITHMLRVRPN
ncbi:acyl dehydratase [Rhodobacteraceae bacterium Araon29]